MTELKPVTRDNLEDVLRLKVAEGQERFVSSAAEALAQAYVYKDTAFPFAVYNGEEAVGFIMLGYYEAKGYYTLWKLFIDREHQHKGFGKQALRLGIAFLKDRFGAKEIYTGVIPDNLNAKALYESLGFTATGLFENGMEEMCLRLVSSD